MSCRALLGKKVAIVCKLRGPHPDPPIKNNRKKKKENNKVGMPKMCGNLAYILCFPFVCDAEAAMHTALGIFGHQYVCMWKCSPATHPCVKEHSVLAGTAALSLATPSSAVPTL